MTVRTARLRPGLLVMTMALLGAVLAVVPTTAAGAAQFPKGFREEVVISRGINAPTLMTHLPDGRILISQQTRSKNVKLVKDGRLSVFLSLPAETSLDRGVLGIAVDPAFGTAGNNFVYVYYHRKDPIRGVISRFTVQGDVADPKSEKIVYEMDPTLKGLHASGEIRFGPDGYLYVSVGDDTRGTEVSQSLTSDLGKILRVDKEGNAPSSNPFYTEARGKYRSIWAIGLRNPFTWSFDRASGRMLIADVGRDLWEELNEGAAGANFGWPTVQGVAGDPRFVDPVHAYRHVDGQCAIIAGDFPDPATSRFPTSYNGKFFFADYCAGWIKTYDPATGKVQDFATGLQFATQIEFGPDGHLYYLTRGRGDLTAKLVRVTHSGDDGTVPSVVEHPVDVSVSEGADAVFTVTAQGSQPLRYAWLRDGDAVAGADSSALTVPGVTAADDGARFSVQVTNAHGSSTSNEAVLTVTAANAAPVISWSVPRPGASYRAGQSVFYGAAASDPEDGPLSRAAFDWEIVFHHNVHTHGFIDPPPGRRNGSFLVPDEGHEEAPDVWFRLHLTVTDSGGRSTSEYRDVVPRLGRLVVDSSPARALITLDGSEYRAPLSSEVVRGMHRDLGVVSPQTIDGDRWVLDGWSDGGAAEHEVVVSGDESAYRAVYRLDAGDVGGGSGLRAEYFGDPTLTTSVLTRAEARPMIERLRTTARPGPGVAAASWSVRYDGSILPQFSEPTTFSVQVTGGVRVWLGGVLLLDRWTSTGAGEYSVPLDLTMGEPVPVRIEYRPDADAPAELRFLWASATMPSSIIPSTQFNAPSDPGSDRLPPDSEVKVPVPGSTVPTGVVRFSGSAMDDVSVAGVAVAVFDRGARAWLRSDGSWGERERLGASLASPGAAATMWSYEAHLPAGSYAVRAIATDGSGRTDPTRPWVRFAVEDGG